MVLASFFIVSSLGTLRLFFFVLIFLFVFFFIGFILVCLVQSVVLLVMSISVTSVSFGIESIIFLLCFDKVFVIGSGMRLFRLRQLRRLLFVSLWNQLICCQLIFKQWKRSFKFFWMVSCWYLKSIGWQKFKMCQIIWMEVFIIFEMVMCVIYFQRWLYFIRYKFLII